MTFGRSGTGMGMENSFPKIREREGYEKKPFPKFVNGKGMKKSIPKIREWELEALIPRNNWEREWKENIQRLKIISQSTSHQKIA